VSGLFNNGKKGVGLFTSCRKKKKVEKGVRFIYQSLNKPDTFFEPDTFFGHLFWHS